MNPYRGETVGEAYQAGPADINEAIGAAVEAFEATRRLSAFERSEALFAISNWVHEEKEEFAQLITSQTGKPVLLSRNLK